MNKLSYLRSPGVNLRYYLKAQPHARQHQYEDAFLRNGKTGLPFTHSWALMGHMHDLRVWTLAYAPSNKGNLQRMQEIHRLNNEMWWNVANAVWKRVFAGIFLWFFLTKIMKHRYMKANNNFDS